MVRPAIDSLLGEPHLQMLGGEKNCSKLAFCEDVLGLCDKDTMN